MPSPEETARSFVEAINSHDPRRILELMTPDGEFTDSLGDAFATDVLLDAWAQYFRMVPDYSIAIEDVLTRDDLVVLFGTANGTYAPDGVLKGENRFRVFAAWRALVRHGRVARWQIFGDNKPVHDLVRGHKA